MILIRGRLLFTATVYLPDTLQAYLSLPADLAATHVYPDGTTPAQALIAQLGALETVAVRMRDSGSSRMRRHC
jgi:hypothetical protein